LTLIGPAEPIGLSATSPTLERVQEFVIAIGWPSVRLAKSSRSSIRATVVEAVSRSTPSMSSASSHSEL
jgi:hypothetical protein